MRKQVGEKMRMAVISDIHGNFEALKRVIADIELSKVDKIMCLGDMIGYRTETFSAINS